MKLEDFLAVQRLRDNFADMTALAKEMQEVYCDKWCGDAFEVARDGHCEGCLSFQQRIKSIEDNQ